jgi:hypothetical protein
MKLTLPKVGTWSCLNPTSRQVWGWNSHSQKWELGVVSTPLRGKCEDETHTPKSGNLESSGTPKNLELDCRGQNTLHWGVLYTVGKVLKCKCPKMVSHEPFGHLQHKLWSKKGSGVKLAIWLSTIKSPESTRSRCVQVECNMLLESSWGELQLCFQSSSQSEVEVGSYELPKFRESKQGYFWDSSLGVPRQKAIWM